MKPTDFTIFELVSTKRNDIYESISEFTNLAIECGKAETLAGISVLLDAEATTKEIRKAIDEALSNLSKEAIEYYCELKARE